MLQKKFLFFVFVFFAVTINAEEIQYCKISPEILKTIAMVERHPKRETGYPYLISFNSKKDSKKISSALEEHSKELFLDARTIDCRNSELCKKITSYIVVQQKIENLDLGPYQINYKWHKMPLKNYFSFENSYIKACRLIEDLVDKHGYTWRTIARYHSGTPKYNYAYLQKISKLLTQGE